MSDHEYDRMPPLVALTAEEAAEAMISEGAPLHQPHGTSSCAPWDDAVECLQKHFNETVVQHPMKSLLVAFGLGMLVGGMFRRD